MLKHVQNFNDHINDNYTSGAIGGLVMCRNLRMHGTLSYRDHHKCLNVAEFLNCKCRMIN